jgi:hypothetical protein
MMTQGNPIVLCKPIWGPKWRGYNKPKMGYIPNILLAMAIGYEQMSKNSEFTLVLPAV